MFEEIQACTACPLHKSLPEGCLPVPGHGNLLAKLMIVGEALGENEAQLQEPFVGPAGKMLKKMLFDAGIGPDSYYITNTVKCWPYNKTVTARKLTTKNRPPLDAEIQACKKWLWKEINTIKPNVIVTLGKIPTYTILHDQLKKSFNLSEVAGTVYNVPWSSSIKILPTYHPSFIMQYGKAKIEECVNHLKKAKEQTWQKTS
jgi:DNA polymerase